MIRRILSRLFAPTPPKPRELAQLRCRDCGALGPVAMTAHAAIAMAQHAGWSSDGRCAECAKRCDGGGVSDE